jgi:hypothetical protein
MEASDDNPRWEAARLEYLQRYIGRKVIAVNDTADGRSTRFEFDGDCVLEFRKIDMTEVRA